MKNMFLFSLLVSAILLFSINGIGQNNPKDTLIHSLQIAETDSARAQLLDQAAQRYFMNGDYETTMVLNLYALDIYERLNDAPQVAAHYDVMGSIYFRQLNFEQALNYFEIAKEMRQKNNDFSGLARSYGNIGNVYEKTGDLDKALFNVKLALMMSKIDNNQKSVGMAYNNLTLIYEKMNYLDTAMLYIDSAIAIKIIQEDERGLASCYSNKGMVLADMEKYEEAKIYFLMAMKTVTELNLTEKIMNGHEDLAEIYSLTNDYKLAFEHQKAFLQLRDSLINQQSTQNINMLAEKYESEKKQQENILLANENNLLESQNQNKKLWITIGFTGVAFLAAVFLIFVVRNNGRKKRKQIEFEKTNLEFEQKALRAQMNPHFLFNAINSIQSYILNKNQHEAYDYLAKFSKLIRIVLNNSQEKNLMLYQELEMIKLYVEMEQMRFNDRFEFNLLMNEDVHEYEMSVPAMLIQPYVENAIWHGLMNLSHTDPFGENERKGILNLSLSMNDTLLKIVVEDNGIGREKSKQYKKEDSHKSVGMQVTEQRLLMINKMEEYENAKVIITDLSDENGKACGTRVEIFIPVNV